MKAKKTSILARSASKDTTDRPSDVQPQPEPHCARLPGSRDSHMIGRLTRLVAALGVAAGAFAIVATATSAHASGTGHVARISSVSAAPARPAVAGHVGWQGTSTYSVPTGAGSLYYHYSCPTGLVVQSGGFQIVGVVSGALTADGPRGDSNYTQWLWYFTWPGGAPHGVSIAFDVYCTKGPA